MNRQNVILALASVATAAVTTHAGAVESFGDRARVLSARAVIERIPVAREECWNETQRSYQDRRVTRSDTGASLGAGTVLGAVIGGVVGHQIGGGSGRDAATGVGAIGGAVIGNQIEQRNRRDDEAYRVTVRLDNGRVAQFDYQRIDDLRVGDRVKWEGGQLMRY